jgi:hypothetical protein
MVNAICGDCFANAAIRSCFVDTFVEFRCIRRVSQKRFHDPASRFPPLAPAGGCSPASAVLSRRYDALPPSRRTSFPSLGSTSAALTDFAPWQVRAPPGPGVSNPVSPAGNSPRSEQGSPKFLGNPNCPFAHVQSTPVGLPAPDHYGAATWPMMSERQRLPRLVFRSSIAWLSDWLSTLRRPGYPDATQDSLPAAGQALPDGLSTRRIPMKGFRFASYISSSFPKLLGASRVAPGVTTTGLPQTRTCPH